ncbi:50S ribosomal protein L3 [Candidatus Pacearchaeota archaeon]|nr:MAG: 50S ribosomal protein L3 [Candidatus Pacearchaeota archaeon]
MPKAKRPRRGSLQFYPRKRARKELPSVNWRPVSALHREQQGLLGVIGYKVGMVSVVVQDQTPDVLTSKKQIVIPATLIEVPPMKIFSVRFYKNGKVEGEVLVANDKELKRKLKVAKKAATKEELEKSKPEEFDEVRVIAFSLVKKTGLKKTPDVIELAVGTGGFEFVKELVGKEVGLESVYLGELVDARGVTKGKGWQGVVKRFGVTLRQHKSEKGVRRVGSIGPWHPARVTFRTPMPGQLGYFTRISYNLKVIATGSISDKQELNPRGGFKHYGLVKTNYILVKGSVPGPVKRALVLTPAFRPSKAKSKTKYELVEVVR